MQHMPLKCMVCSKPTTGDIETLNIRNRYICNGCEQRIVNIKVSDQEYEAIKDRIKTLIFNHSDLQE